jgi:hypothetical protein
MTIRILEGGFADLMVIGPSVAAPCPGQTMLITTGLTSSNSKGWGTPIARLFAWDVPIARL